jgi:hypothetical protein
MKKPIKSRTMASDIKPRLIEVLNREHYTFAQLAEYLHMTEDGLTHQLQNKTLEFRCLEAISKVLRVPLYSFFSEGAEYAHLHEKPHYVNRLWTENDEKKTKVNLKKEIDILKRIIKQKEEQLAKMGG